MDWAAEMVVDAVVCVGFGRDVSGVCAVVSGVFGDEVRSRVFCIVEWLADVQVAVGDAGRRLYTWYVALGERVILIERGAKMQARCTTCRHGIKKTRRVSGRPCSSLARCLPGPRVI